MNSRGYYSVSYIGYCADEEKRYSKRILNERYPLVEENILEKDILEWAKNIPIFNDFYKYNRRCGCMYCPMASLKEIAYLYKYYPDNYSYMLNKIRETERKVEQKYGKPFAIRGGKYNADYIDYIIKTKWVNKL